MDPSTLGADALLLIVYVISALAFSFLCSLCEAALLSMTPSYIASLKESDPIKAGKLKNLRETNLDQSLAAILTVNTIAHTLGAIGAGSKATAVFGEVWFGVFSAIMTLLILFLSEIVPKTLGATHWKKLAGFTVIYVNFMVKVMYPLILVSEKLTRFISKGKKDNDVDLGEFAAMANMGEAQGVLSDRESAIIQNLLELRSVNVSDVMTPRIVMFTLNKDLTVDEALKVRTHTPFSRIPIYEDEPDHLIGFVLREALSNAQARKQGDMPIHELKRDLLAVSDAAPLSKVLEIFLEQHHHIAMVINEYGEAKGLLTLEDLVETLLGEEIVDEGDKVADMRELARKRWQRRAKRMGIEV